MSSSIMAVNQSANFIGDKIQADGYFGYADGLHTIAIYTSGLTGRIHLQGTLADDPTDNDWFDINLQANLAHVDYSTDTGVHGYTFQGNFIYLRITLTNYATGTLSKVLLKI